MILMCMRESSLKIYNEKYTEISWHSLLSRGDDGLSNKEK